MNADDAKGAADLLSPVQVESIRVSTKAIGVHLAEHDVFPINPEDGSFVITDARHANLENMCEGMLRSLVSCWGALVTLLDHVAALGTDQDAETSIRLVLGYHGAPQGVDPMPWQRQLIDLIVAGDMLQRTELATVYPGLVSSVVTYEADGVNALYMALAMISTQRR